MIPPFRSDGYEVLDARCHVAATCATVTMAEQIVDALNDAEALREKLASKGITIDQIALDRIRNAATKERL